MNARRAAAGLGRTAAWFVILGTTAVIAIAVLVPRIGGGTPYVVLTGSMRPAMPPGTLVVVRPVSADKVRVGDVITYQLRSGEATVVTHRVVSVAIDGRGRRTFVTKGDANGVRDPAAVRPVQIKGARWYSVPYLGYVTSAITGEQRRIALWSVESALLLYAAAMFVSALRDRLRRRRTAAA